MMTELTYLNPKDTELLVIQAMEALCGDDSYISLEGFHVPKAVTLLPEASSIETEVLRRNTIAPVLQFVVVPLNRSNVATLAAAVGQASILKDVAGLIHIQISKGGRLAFGAYDNVDEDCTVLYPPFAQSLCETLLSSGAIESFTVRSHHGA